MTEKTEPKSKHDLLEIMEYERHCFDVLIETLTETKMLKPGPEGNRNVKDIVAHITDWEQRLIQWIDESFSGSIPQRPAPGMTWDDLDKLNEQTYLANRDKPLPDIMSDSSSSYKQVLRIVKKMTDQDLFDGSRFAWRTGDPMWHMVAANTWWHYKEHREQIETWLTSNS